MTIRAGLAITALWLSTAGPAQAHEYWLQPSRYRASVGDTVRIEAIVGTGFRGDAKPWATTRAVRFEARAGQVIDLRPAAINGNEDWATLVVPDAGGLAFAYEGEFAFIEMPGDEFEAYLTLEGLDAPRRLRAAAGQSGAPARERYARCPRTWVAGSDPSRVTRPAGLTLELVPLTDPTRGATAVFQLLLRGEPLAGARVRAWRQPLASDDAPRIGAARDSVGPEFEARSDAGGRVRIPLRGRGEWLVSAVHMEPSTTPHEADWQSWWASFTFARPGARGDARRGRH